MSKENFILYQWNNETKEFWFLGEKIDYVHNPSEWKKYLNNLVNENKELKERINKIDKFVSSLSSVGRGCEIYADVKRDILNVVRGK